MEPSRFGKLTRQGTKSGRKAPSCQHFGLWGCTLQVGSSLTQRPGHVCWTSPITSKVKSTSRRSEQGNLTGSRPFWPKHKWVWQSQWKLHRAALRICTISPNYTGTEWKSWFTELEYCYSDRFKEQAQTYNIIRTS